MKLAVLTTQTPHHSRFVQGMTNMGWDIRVFVETRGLAAPFPTAHPFEQDRDRHEKESWFDGHDPGCQAFADTLTFADMNGADAIQAVGDWTPDMVVVFGTGRLHAPLLSACPPVTLNLHGGCPEEYRGLDSHLWAIYHGDFGGLVTTLHRLNAQLDDGAIVAQAALPIRPAMGLYQLRMVNTEACIRLVGAAMDMVARHGDVVSRPQRRAGRYYSFMPSPLKDVCVTRFTRHTARLP